MTRTSIFALALGAGSLLMMTGQPARAEDPASQADIAGKLYPKPRGHGYDEDRGVPNVGSMSRSTRPESEYQHISLGEPRHGHAARRPSAAETAILPGCPGSSVAATKPAVSLPQITFDFGSAELKPEAIETLRNLGKALNEQLRDQKLFTIEGHTDAVGTFEQNEELSRSRAEAVREFLVRNMSVAQDRLGIVGKAYCEPADPQHPYDPGNRRVVVINQS